MADRQDRRQTGGRGTPRLGLLRQDSRRWEELFGKGGRLTRSATDPRLAAELERSPPCWERCLPPVSRFHGSRSRYIRVLFLSKLVFEILRGSPSRISELEPNFPALLTRHRNILWPIYCQTYHYPFTSFTIFAGSRRVLKRLPEERCHGGRSERWKLKTKAAGELFEHHPRGPDSAPLPSRNCFQGVNASHISGRVQV